MRNGHVAEWLRTGLQNRVRRFNSGRGLQPSLLRSFGSASLLMRRLPRRSRVAAKAGWLFGGTMSNRYAKFLVASLAALVFVATAERGWAGSYNDAMTLYYKGDFAGAAQALRALAERGDDTAQRELGRMHVKGEGVPKDEEEAKKLFKMANEQSDALKAYNQGDFVTAMRVFRPLAEKGQPLAEYILGLMYANAQGVPENYPEALT